MIIPAENTAKVGVPCRKGDSLPWNRLAPISALVETLRESFEVVGTAIDGTDGRPRRKKALVPGRGRGVDLSLLECFGFDGIGLEVSETAVHAAVKFGNEHHSKYAVDEKIGKGS